MVVIILIRFIIIKIARHPFKIRNTYIVFFRSKINSEIRCQVAPAHVANNKGKFIQNYSFFLHFCSFVVISAILPTVRFQSTTKWHCYRGDDEEQEGKSFNSSERWSMALRATVA